MPRDGMGSGVRWYAVRLDIGETLRRENWDAEARQWRLGVTLTEAGLEHYLPTIVRPVCRRGKREVSRWGMLPGYGFVRFNLDDWGQRLKLEGHPDDRTVDGRIDGVTGLVRGAGCIVAVTDRSLEAVRAMETSEGGISEKAAARFKRGAYVRATQGPFYGFAGPVRKIYEKGVPLTDFEGRVIEHSSERVIVVDIEMFGRSGVPKEFAEAQLEPA